MQGIFGSRLDYHERELGLAMPHRHFFPSYSQTLSRSEVRTNLQSIEYIQTPRHSMHHPTVSMNDGLSAIRYQVESGMAQLLKRTAIRTSMDQKQQINGNQAPWAKKRHTTFLRVHIKILSPPYSSHSPPFPSLFRRGPFLLYKILGQTVG